MRSRSTIAWLTALTFVAGTARAQLRPGELVVPGTTTATATDADAARVNMGAVPLLRDWSLRYTHVEQLAPQARTLTGDAVTYTAPLFFGLAGSLGVSWSRPDVPAVMGGPPATRGHLVSAEFGLAYALSRRMGVGTRLRVMGASGEGELAQLANGAAGLDLGIAWHPATWLALGLTGQNLLGPRAPAIGMDRGAVLGVGVRPTGDDLLTVGVDGYATQAGTLGVRGGVRVAVPYVGTLRAEGLYDSTGAWGASVGLDVNWGQGSIGGGGLFGSNGTAGFYATARLEGERDRGIPVPPVVIALRTDDDLSARGVGRMVVRFERLSRDPSVRGVVYSPRGDVGGIANAEELRIAFTRFRATGRRVVCHLTEASGAAYYACAAANAIVMDPAGMLRMAGIRTGRFFLGDALTAVGVRAEFVRIGRWKSAPEQFTRAHSTPEALAQENQLLDDFYTNLLDGIAQSRTRPRADVQRLIEAGPYTAREARAAGLIDELGTREQAERSLARTQGASLVEYDDYSPMRPRRWAPGRAVAVLYIDGDIVDGDSVDIPIPIPFLGSRMVGDRTIVRLVDQLAADPRYAAIVLRVDSGGGSATASEMMWRAIERAARRKPVIVSMGRVAASGGYYVAAPGREIFANASTLTGSIGIFFGKVDVSPLLARVGVGIENNRRGPHADMDSMYRPFTDEERAIVSRMITESYNVFLQRVAAGRHTTTAAIDAVGQGRVFAGTRAQRVGLVDRIGGLADALARARQIAGVPDDIDVVELPTPTQGILSTLTSLFTSEPSTTPAARIAGRSELAQAMRWMVTIAYSGTGQPMAMTEWPLLAP